MSDDRQLQTDELGFDLDQALDAIVSIKTTIPDGALTATILGTERGGNGVVISDDGLVLTIGYLITEASDVWLTKCDGQSVPGHVVASDQQSGLGLVQGLYPLGLASIALGSSASLQPGSPVIAAGSGGARQALQTSIIAKREFTGYWEYVLDEALFTAPALPNWGGAALLNTEGNLVGIGSLLIQNEGEGNANMFVPVDLLAPILTDLRQFGRRQEAPRPWLGWLVQEVDQALIVTTIYRDCPAHAAGIRPGDVVLDIEGNRPAGLTEMFRMIWQAGPAGIRIPISVLRDGALEQVSVATVDRDTILTRAVVH